MKQDIRNMFRDEEFQKKKLPDSHQEEFLQKLKRRTPSKSIKKPLYLLKIAASILLVFSSVYFYQEFQKKAEKTTLEIQVAQIEKEYLKSIDNEWQGFVKVTNDQNLVGRYEEKLSSLGDNYKKVSGEFKKDPNNILILESLIENLQRRLQLLKNIRQHIQELNQKNKSYETIII